jgi:hypothetical protein
VKSVALKTVERPDHPALADALRRRVLEGPGEIAPALRQAIARSATGGAAAQPPYDALARQIGEAANRTTDDEVASVVSATGSDKATFEVIVAAAVAAGLFRWQQAIDVLDEATHARS